MPTKLDTQIFVSKSLQKFGNYLDYSLVNYKTNELILF